MKYPKGIKAVYDDGKSIDRYTVYYSRRSDWGIVRGTHSFQMNLYPCVGMNCAPFHPQGFGQHGSGCLGRHNGKRIRFEDLPADCQKLVMQDLNQ